MAKTIYIEGEGCNRRMLDQARLTEYFRVNGFRLAKKPDDADYILLTTCAFKGDEKDYSSSRIGALGKYSAELIVCGCLPSIAPESYEELGNPKFFSPDDLDKVDSFFEDNKIKFSEVPDAHLVNYYENAGVLQTLKRKLTAKDLFARDQLTRAAASARKRLDHFFRRSSKDYFLYCCRGCLGHCSYCGIRRAIGSVCSQPVAEVIEGFREGYDAGHRNFIILGDDVGCYGVDIDSTLPELLSSILQECATVAERQGTGDKNGGGIGLHVKETHPKYLLLYGKELLDLVASPMIRSILCPIQSGSDRVLDLMRREHSAADIKDLIIGLRDANPGLELSTQIIVGFPTETDEDFLNTLRLVRESKFDEVTVFSYDDIENTHASSLEGKVAEDVMRQRTRKAQKYLQQAGLKVHLKCPL